jgi:hypothetical protein
MGGVLCLERREKWWLLGVMAPELIERRVGHGEGFDCLLFEDREYQANGEIGGGGYQG